MKMNSNQKNLLQTEVNNLMASIWEVRDVIMARKYVNMVKEGIVDNTGLVILAHGKQIHNLTLNTLR